MENVSNEIRIKMEENYNFLWVTITELRAKNLSILAE